MKRAKINFDLIANEIKSNQAEKTRKNFCKSTEGAAFG